MGRRIFYAEFSGFDDYLSRLKKMNVNLKPIVEDALEQASDDPTADTVDAMKDKYLPAKGKYSTGNTAKTVIRNPKVTWETSDIASIGIGFDHTEHGAGTLLITGTPRMKPDRKLEQIYARKKTVREFNSVVGEVLAEALIEEMNK